MSEELIVRTMKDDIARAQATPVEEKQSPKTKEQPILAPRHEEVQPPTFSLPASRPTPVLQQQEAPKGKEIIKTPDKKHHPIILGAVYILIFCALAGGGVYAYMRFAQNLTFFQQPQEEKQLTLHEAIPKEAIAVVDYDVSSQDNKNIAMSLWGVARSEGGSDPASGNPSALISISDVSHVYYVLLHENTSPYVLVQKTPGVKEFVSQQSNIQSLDIGGWYVMHDTTTDGYVVALASGSLSEDSPLIASSAGSSYVVQYSLSPALVAEEFNTISSSILGVSGLPGLAFQITAPTDSNGIVSAVARIPGSPTPIGVPISTKELSSLIPADSNFARVGTDFSADLAKWQSDTSRLDSTVLDQPTVRQFLSLLDAPYAVFERTGADGVRDIGAIIQLPASLQRTLRVGEPVIEQALSSLIPLIVGKTLGIQVAFDDGIYNGVNLRYVNLNGQTQALDYVVGDNFLLISSSREGIYSVINTSLGGVQGISTSDAWRLLFAKAGLPADSQPFLLGAIKNPNLVRLLPVFSTSGQVPVLVASHQTSTGLEVNATIASK